MKGLIDSTLREGSQTFGLAFSRAQKKEIFSGLCRVGIEEIELGIVTPLDEDLPSLIRFCRAHDAERRLALWCRCRKEDIHFAAVLAPDVLSLSIPVSDLHIEKKFGRDREWVVETARTAIMEARQLGFRVVSLGLEDATRAERHFLEKIVKTAIAAGVDRVRLADTVGIASPIEIAGLVQRIKDIGTVEVGVHMHNDFGMATANSLASLDAGADWADATVLGLGERAGNASLEELTGYLALQRNRIYKMELLKDLAVKVAQMSGRTIEPHNPITGERIFYCETGLHLQGLKKDTAIYEPFAPKSIGATRKLRYGTKIGKKEVLRYLGKMKKNAANINVDEIVLSVRRKADVIGRPLKGREFLRLITSVFNNQGI